jgi:hypothetical protein
MAAMAQANCLDALNFMENPRMALAALQSRTGENSHKRANHPLKSPVPPAD